MKVVGIIAEFNPFHTGHAYLIKQAKEACAADYCIVVMSGDYVQRGEPAFFTKELRTQTALENGADLVLEIPVSMATGSAEYFAQAGVRLLNSLGCVTHLCFGSESGDITPFSEAASALLFEDATYKELLNNKMREGLSFPQARYQALAENSAISPQALELLNSPNNLLGVEYVKALKQTGSSIKPITIQRVGAGYHDRLSTSSFASATGLREKMQTSAVSTGTTMSESQPTTLMELSQDRTDYVPTSMPVTTGEQSGTWMDYVPESAKVAYTAALSGHQYAVSDAFFSMLQYKILQGTARDLERFQDVSEELASKIWNLRYEAKGFTDYTLKIKSKNLTYTRISRALIHILLEITKEDVSYQATSGYVLYARMLGFKKEASALLTAIKKEGTLPLISKLSDAKDKLSEDAFAQLSQTLHGSDLYHSVLNATAKTPVKNDLSQALIIL